MIFKMTLKYYLLIILVILIIHIHSDPIEEPDKPHVDQVFYIGN